MSILSTTSRHTVALAHRMGRSLVLPAAPLAHLNRSFWSTAQDNARKDMIKSAPMWKDENATESEADIKADREPLPHNVHELQRESIKVLQSKQNGNNRKAGSNHDRH